MILMTYTRGVKGFTLIELSLVLVIIGLIIGGILAGQELIKASTIRSTIKQYEQFKIATNTFRNKYGGLPGDLHASKVSNFDLCPDIGCPNGSACAGDGNDVICYTGETFSAWNQLYLAELVNGDFSGADAIPASMYVVPTTQGDNAAEMRKILPPAKIGRQAYWFLSASVENTNYFTLAGYSSITNMFNAFNLTTENRTRSLTPMEAFQLDSKIDDGLPRTGKMLAKNAVTNGRPADDSLVISAAWSTATPSSAVAGDCITGGASAADTANIYATAASASANTPACLLRVAF